MKKAALLYFFFLSLEITDRFGRTRTFAPTAQSLILWDDWKRLVARLRTVGRPSDFGRPAYDHLGLDPQTRSAQATLFEARAFEDAAFEDVAE